MLVKSGSIYVKLRPK